MPPLNTAINNGYNRLFNERRKLGSWTEYLAIRERLLTVNGEHRQRLSNDLGAIAGLLFEIGAGNLLVPNLAGQPAVEHEKLLKQLAKRQKNIIDEEREDQAHSEMQHHLLTIGRALGYDVAVARNDIARQYNGHKFSFLSLPALPPLPVLVETSQTIGLIDVVWLQKGIDRLVCAFEVEKSTSIYSGILRLTDLACSLPDHATTLYWECFTVISMTPSKREKQLAPTMTVH